jgi:thiosulfate dehydrogenase [quinone] large subunit
MMRFLGESRDARVPAALLVALRVYLGIVFLVAAWPKLTTPGGFGARLEAFVERAALPNAHAFYRPFLESVVLPNAGAFASLVALGELFVGFSLVAGAGARLGGVGAAFLTLNYLFAKGNWFWTPSSNDAAMFMIALVVTIGGGGRGFGVDYWLWRRWPRVWLW